MRGDAIYSRYYQYALGPEYRRVEYLESSGAAYIDTGVASALDISVYFRAQLLSRSTLVSSGNEKQGGICVSHWQNPFSFAFNFGDTGYNPVRGVIPIDVQEIYEIVLDKDMYSVNGQSTSNIASSISTSSHLHLFRDVWNLNPVDTKIYLAKIRKNGTPVRNLVPAVRVSDSKPGMYDLCGSICPLTNTPFYINGGNGDDFTWGELQS